jgi:hypothetical protein
VTLVNGCVRAASSSGMSLRRHRAFLDRENRRAGFAIEHEQHSALCRLQDRWNRPVVAA